MTPLMLVLSSLSLAPPSDPIPSPPLPGQLIGPVAPPYLPPPPAASAVPYYRGTDTTVKHLNACPDSPLYPFLRLPSVRPVGPCVAGPGDGSPGATQDHWVHEFHQAAHFPFPRYDQVGNLLTWDGLLIYEGMRLTVNQVTGAYDIEFTTTIPSMPVTLHLQLVFRKGDATPPHRLTLPPIRLEPLARTANGDPSGNTFQVNHRGYSSLFRTELPPLKCPPGAEKVTCNWEVGRVGSARFGSALAVDDLGR